MSVAALPDFISAQAPFGPVLLVAWVEQGTAIFGLVIDTDGSPKLVRSDDLVIDWRYDARDKTWADVAELEREMLAEEG